VRELFELATTGFGLFGGGSTGLGTIGDIANQLLPGRIGARQDLLGRRRRRRKALTNSDMNLALTIASAISKKAAENFILSRTRAA